MQGDLIETYWDVKKKWQEEVKKKLVDLIETYWDVKC